MTMDWRELASQGLDRKVEIAPGHLVTNRDLAVSHLRLLVFAAIQHHDDELRREAISVVKDALTCSEVFDQTRPDRDRGAQPETREAEW